LIFARWSNFLSDIFREIEDEIRQDKAKSLWKTYGVYFISLAALIVASVGGFKAWEYYSLQQLENAGAKYLENMALIDNGKEAEALDAFNSLSQKGSSGFYLLAKFQEAGLLAQTGNNDAAVAVYDTLASDTALIDSLRDLARFRAGLLLSNTAPLSEVEARVGKLAVSGNAWRHSAWEILAITAFRTGNLDKAEQIFIQLISDPETPNPMRARITAMMSIIAPQLPAPAAPKQETKPDDQ